MSERAGGSHGVEDIVAGRRAHGPVQRKAPGPTAWFDVRGRRLGQVAFSLNRFTGLGLVLYLFLHLAVLTQLLAGASAWNGFLRLATTPVFLGLDVLLIFGLLVHGLNGLRVALVGTGLVPNRQRALFLSLMAFGAIVLLYSALHILGES